VTAQSPLTYAAVLRDRRIAALLLGDLLSLVGNGMVIVALPVLVLRIHGDVPAALAIAVVETSAYLLATVLAFTLGLSRLRLPPRGLLLADCVLRAVTFIPLGVLALRDGLSLWTLVAGLLIGSTFRLVGSSSRRLLATGMVGPEGLLAVNGLLSTGGNLALYVAGPVLGGLVAVAVGPGAALLADAALTLVLLVITLTTVRRGPAEPTGETVPASGLRILRRFPVAARLFVVVFFFNLFYMPVEIALPLLVQRQMHGDGAQLGLMWGGFGAGCLVGALLLNLLRRVPQLPLLVTVIGGWAVAMMLLSVAPTVPVGVLVFALGGLIWAPFTPVAYSLVQSLLAPAEQPPVVTLWAAGGTLAAPIGLALGGPLVDLAGARGGLMVSALLTLALVPWAAWGLRRSTGAGDAGTGPEPPAARQGAGHAPGSSSSRP
jgi:transmembrane secretion effector